MGSSPANTEANRTKEQFLVDLAQWLARRTQYSATHPSCAKLGVNVHAALSRALAFDSLLELAILKDGVLMGETPAMHRAIITRVAPHLHARGVQVVRFATGTTLEELSGFIEVLTLPVQTAFDRGGIVALLAERGISRIQVDEIAHDVDPNMQAEQKRRRDRRELFAEALRQLLAGRLVRGLSGEELLALLDDPETAVLLLEEDPSAVTDAVAGLCFMVRKEEARSGRELFPKLRTILLMLSPASHATVLVGFPSLLGNFRAALAWAFDRLSEEDLARFVVPALRVHDPDVVLYAVSVAIPHDGTRYGTLRLVALRLHDLHQATDDELLRALAQPIDDFDCYRRERECLAPEAKRAIDARALFPPVSDRQAFTGTTETLAPLDSRRALHDLVLLQARRPWFAKVCERLPRASARLTSAGSYEGVVGVLHGLSEAADTSSTAPREVLERAMKEIATSSVCAHLLKELEGTTSERSMDVAKLAPTVNLLVKVNPMEVWAHLERAQSAVMQQVLLDALANAGASMLPVLRGKIRTSPPTVVRQIVHLLPRLGGTTRDLFLVSRHPNERVRTEVVSSLRALPPDETTMDILVSYLEDESQELRMTARSMLRAELLSPSAIATLERIADDPEQQDALRRRAVEVLGRSLREVAADALYRLLEPRSLLELASIRDAAAVALRHSPAPNAAALFQKGLASNVRRIRKACERADRGGA